MILIKIKLYYNENRAGVLGNYQKFKIYHIIHKTIHYSPIAAAKRGVCYIYSHI